MRTLLVVILGCSALAAHADTYQQFDLNATFANGGTITGTVDLDMDSTLTYNPGAQYANLVYTLSGTATSIVEYNQSEASNHLGTETQINYDFGPYGTEFLLDLPTTTPFVFAGFTGGLCTGNCAAFNSSIVSGTFTETFNWVTSGTFVADGAPYSLAPEPGSLMLLGTAGLGLFWRRVRS